jgi:CRP-like cAMP-binding protein
MAYRKRLSDTRILQPFNIVEQNSCPMYLEEDAFTLANDLLYPPSGKPACLTLALDVQKLGEELEATGGIVYPSSFGCSGCEESNSVTLERPTIPNISPKNEKLILSLQKYSFFKLLRKEDIFSVLPALDVVNLDTGAPIIKRGNGGDFLYLILSGIATVVSSDGEGVIATFGNGSLLGEMSLLTGNPFVDTIVASEPMVLLVMKSSVIKTLIEQHPKLQYFFYRLLSERLSTNQYTSLMSGSHLSGTLNHWTFPEILQILNVNEKSGILEVSKDQICAHLLFNSGEIVAVHFNNLPDTEAFYELFRITEGDFTFRIEDPVEADYPKQPIGSFMQLIMEAVVRNDEANG